MYDVYLILFLETNPLGTITLFWGSASFCQAISLCSSIEVEKQVTEMLQQGIYTKKFQCFCFACVTS
jgi:hypothetical protein